MKKFLFFIIYIPSIFLLPVSVIHGIYNIKVIIKINWRKWKSFFILWRTMSKSLWRNKIQFKIWSDFSILSISQGGLIARYIIQKCDMKG